MEGIYTMHALHGGREVVNVDPPVMELAQAYVRPQPLDEIFSPKEGLRHGTAFPNLYMPYTPKNGMVSAPTEVECVSERCKLLDKITKLDFMALDLQLYLNTNPADLNAIEMYNSCIAGCQAAREKYEANYGPMTAFRSEGAICDQTGEWAWNTGPWPWQADFMTDMEGK